MVPPFLEAHSRLRKSKEFDAVSFAGLAILDDKAAVRRGTWRDAKVGQRDSAERSGLRYSERRCLSCTSHTPPESWCRELWLSPK